MAKSLHRGGSGNFAENRQRASEAGRKGGQHSRQRSQQQQQQQSGGGSRQQGDGGGMSWDGNPQDSAGSWSDTPAQPGSKQR